MIRIIKNMKLFNKLILSFISVILIPLLLVSFIIYSKSIKSIKENALDSSNILSIQLTQSINNFVNESNRITKSILIDTDIIERVSGEEQIPMSEEIRNKLDVDQLLTRIITLKPEINSIILMTDQSVYYYNDKDWILNEDVLRQQEWLNQIYETNSTMTITNLHNIEYYENMSDDVVFTVGRVLLKPNGSYAGLLLMDLKPSDLLEMNNELLSAIEKYGMKFIITNNSGGIVYHSDMLAKGVKWVDYTDKQYIIDAKDRETDYLYTTNELNEGTLDVNIVISKERLFQHIEGIRYITTVAAILCAIFVIIISNIISYKITKPITKLKKSMKLAENANYNTIKSLGRTDEIGSLIDSYNSMIIKIEKLINDVYIADIKQREAKILALQTQINPHMLFNTLESIRMKALVKGDDEIADMIKTLARMYKVVLGKEGKDNYFRNEVEYARDYIRLQNNRFDNMFSLDIELNKEILDSRIMVFILQPIIENCINHGFYGYSQHLTILVKGLVTNENDIIIRVSDDGKGLDPEKVIEINSYLEMDEKKLLNDDLSRVRKSIGLKNISERIRLYYGENYYLRIESTRHVGSTIEFKVPKL